MKRKRIDRDAYDGRRPLPRNASGKAPGTWNSKRTRSTKMPAPGKSGKVLTTFPPKVFEKLVWLSEAENVPLAQIVREACESYTYVVQAKIDAVQIARLKAAKRAGERAQAAGELHQPGDETLRLMTTSQHKRTMER